MSPFLKLRVTVLLLLLALTVGCDQTSKHFARAELSQLGAVSLPGGFGELRLADNPGSFLSLGASLPGPTRLLLLTIGVAVALVALFAYLARNTAPDWLSFLGLALVWSGGTSNLIDRVTRHGLVTDFVFLQVGPLHTGVFNLADFVIVIGVTLLVCSLIKRPSKPASAGNTTR